MRNRPVYPHLMSHCQVQNETETWPGMTLREYAAVAAMQGICASYQHRVLYNDNDADRWAEESVHIADALLAKLEEKQ